MKLSLALRSRSLRKTGFTGFLDIAPGAVAAYSLRNLTKDWAFQAVVRVRRSSDNAERDFTELEIENGTMLSWVNTNVVVSLNSDITSASNWTLGGLTSYNSGTQAFDCSSENSLTIRQPLSQNQCVFHFAIEVSAYTSGSFRVYAGGNVSTEVVSSAGTFTGTLTGGSSNSFFGINPSSFSGSIASFTVTQQTASGHTTTWYDQSGNSRNATQTTAASQPKIVDAGTLVLSNSLPALSFDDVDDFFRFPSGLVTSDHSMLLVAEQKNTNGALLAIADVGGYYLRYTGTNPATLLWYIPDTTNAVLAQVNATASQELLTFYKTATNVYSRVNGANEASRASSGSLTTSPSAIGRYGSAYVEMSA